MKKNRQRLYEPSKVVDGYDAGFGGRLSSVIAVLGGLKPAARVAKVTDEQIAKWRDGVARPPFFALRDLSVAARVRLDWLGTGEGPMLDQDALQPPEPPPESADEELIERCMVLVEEVLDELGKRLPPDVKAELVMHVYRLERAEREKGAPGLGGAEIIRLIRRAG